MENIAGIELVPRYIGVMMDMLELILLTLSICALVFLYTNKQKINKILFYVFQAILWFVMLVSLWYIIGGVIIFLQRFWC